MPIEVSIVIPVYNEEHYIAQCLESLIKQDFPKEKFEILLVDGKSTDNTINIIESYLEQNKHIRLLNNPDKTTPKGMNIGIKSARGNIIIVTSAHALLQNDYLSKCISTFERTDAISVGGQMITLPKNTSLIAKAISIATAHVFGVGNSKFRTSTKAGYVDTVAFGAFKKEIFDKIGLFNEQLPRNQDLEFNSRIIKNGGKIYLNPEIKSYYYNRSTLKELWKQNFTNGQWNIYTYLISQESLSTRHFIPFIFVLSIMINLLISFYSLIGKILLFIVLISHSILSFTFSLKLSIKHDMRLFTLLPIVFLVLHLSYGCGSMWGLITLKRFKQKYD
jgi:glycosyltransferase involved in cell wall biosynthesis